jgi:hypothetical protein
MVGKYVKGSRVLVRALITLLAWVGVVQSQEWTALKHQPSFPVGATALLTDGTVLLHEEQDDSPQNWYKLMPDDTGSYVNGTITKIASLPTGYGPLYFGSVVLPDGRYIIEGGEYNLGYGAATTKGAIYDPVKNTWTSVKPPDGWNYIGDSPSAVLPDGIYLQSDCCDYPPNAALFNAKTLTWTSTGGGKFDVYDEEGITLLPGGNLLDVDAYVFHYDATGMNSEIYDTSAGNWSSAGSTVVQLWDSAAKCGGASRASYELGPAVLRPDGTVFATGANRCGSGNTAIYDTSTGTWTAGPAFPDDLQIHDGPAALETNGNVVMMTSPGLILGSVFFEWDGTNLAKISGPPNAHQDASFYGHFLELPSGQLLFTDFSSDMEVFTPKGNFKSAWRPKVTNVSATLTRGTTYTLKGKQLNGVSQGAAYGDDFQDATNYPLVRITNSATGHVFYCKTHDHSTMGVATGNTLVSTKFDVPTGAETGDSALEVVANGIPSKGVAVTVQ